LCLLSDALLYQSKPSLAAGYFIFSLFATRNLFALVNVHFSIIFRNLFKIIIYTVLSFTGTTFDKTQIDRIRIIVLWTAIHHFKETAIALKYMIDFAPGRSQVAY